MGKGNKNKRRNMTNVKNTIDTSQSLDTTSPVVEASIAEPHNIEEQNNETDEPVSQSNFVEDIYQNEPQDNEALICKIADLHDLLNKLRSGEEYKFCESSAEFLLDAQKRYCSLQSLIQKANIAFESLNSSISTIIADTKIFEKNFDVLCLFKSPDINKEAEDWFLSLSKALDLMEKAVKGEIDEKLDRIPPSNFRACIKNSSKFDPIYTISVLTPIYRVKAGTCTDDFFPIAWKGANSFSLHSKYLLNTEQKLKSVLLKVLSESDNDKEIKSLCLVPPIVGDKEPQKYLEDIELRLSDIKSDIEIKDYNNIEELKNIEESLQKFPDDLININSSLYETKEKLSDCISSVEKQFYKVALSDLFKMYNDIVKQILYFEKAEVETLCKEESQKWHDMLLGIKGKITDYLNRLGIYENKTVIENETIWQDDMDFIEIMEGEEDDNKPEGLISKINSIGFHYIDGENKKKYIEKTKVFVYRKS